MISKQDFLKGITGKPVELDLEGIGVIKVKGLSVAELTEIQGLSEKDDMLAALYTIVYGVVEPKLDKEDVEYIKQATPKLTMVIANKISELTGLSNKTDSP